mmetsp:Transcript_124374/g.346235  ORF Transcript_124374/g.346235 Transcript_124374/m.346235 type:complete len:746 (+) Transcript_124374:20-2257(+)
MTVANCGASDQLFPNIVQEVLAEAAKRITTEHERSLSRWGDAKGAVVNAGIGGISAPTKHVQARGVTENIPAPVAPPPLLSTNGTCNAQDDDSPWCLAKDQWASPSSLAATAGLQAAHESPNSRRPQTEKPDEVEEVPSGLAEPEVPGVPALTQLERSNTKNCAAGSTSPRRLSRAVSAWLQPPEEALSRSAVFPDIADLSFAVLPLWLQGVPDMVTTASSARPNQLLCLKDPQHEARKALRCRVPVLNPTSVKKRIWDIITLICTLHDLVVAPLEFLDVPANTASSLMAWVTRLFWTCDMGVSFLTGINLPDGTLEMRPKRIARRYASTWLLPDAVLVLVDWLEAFTDSPSSVARVFRMMRLVRLHRLLKLLNAAAEKAHSEGLILLISIIASTGAVLAAVHGAACIWLGIGRASKENWVARMGVDEDHRWLQYVMAIHWSLTNLAGNIELFPETILERCFAVVSLFAGFLLASGFVSNITSSLMRLSFLTDKNALQFTKLNKYMREHAISPDLARRVHLNAKQATAEQEEHMQESDVELLAVVSEPLRAELHLEIHAPVLIAHPLFHRLLLECPRAMQQICHSAVSTVLVQEGDVLFSRGEVPNAPRMFFILSGEVEYTQDGLTRRTAKDGQWVCEQVLWTQWVYHGNLQGSTDCKMLALDASVFWRIASPGNTAGLDLGKYAAEFVKWQNSRPEARSDLGSLQDSVRLIGQAYGRKSRRTSSIIRDSCNATLANLASVTPRP